MGSTDAIAAYVVYFRKYSALLLSARFRVKCLNCDRSWDRLTKLGIWGYLSVLTNVPQLLDLNSYLLFYVLGNNYKKSLVGV